MFKYKDTDVSGQVMRKTFFTVGTSGTVFGCVNTSALANQFVSCWTQNSCNCLILVHIQPTSEAVGGLCMLSYTKVESHTDREAEVYADNNTFYGKVAS